MSVFSQSDMLVRCTWGKRKERRKSSGKSTQVDGEREGREGDGLSGEVGLGRDFGEVERACWDFGEVGSRFPCCVLLVLSWNTAGGGNCI